MDQPFVRDAALFVLRVTLGLIFIVHGLEKFLVSGISGTQEQFATWGIPQPRLCATIAATGEVLGGAMLMIGLLTTFFAGALALEMIAAIVLVNLANGFFVADGGFEYAAVLFVSLLIIVVFGAGRASLDEVLTRADL